MAVGSLSPVATRLTWNLSSIMAGLAGACAKTKKPQNIMNVKIKPPVINPTKNLLCNF